MRRCGERDIIPARKNRPIGWNADELNLAGTAEVPLTAYRMGEILNEEDLPIKFAGMSTCFRREAGAAGKDTYGLYRIHQFDKVEQVVICKNSVEESNKFHEEILSNSEVVMRALETALPRRGRLHGRPRQRPGEKIRYRGVDASRGTITAKRTAQVNFTNFRPGE